MNILKIKVAIPSAAVGASFLQSLIWYDNHYSLWWVWWVVAAFCIAIIDMVEGLEGRMKAKIYVSGLFMGAACVPISLQLFSSDYNFEFDSVGVLSLVVIAAVMVIMMVKPLKPLPAS